ncbi:MAG: hypothetical protein ACM3JB_05080 [Acidobacteriaceae bacterium]
MKRGRQKVASSALDFRALPNRAMPGTKLRAMRDVPGDLYAGGSVWLIRVNLIVSAGGTVMRLEPGDLGETFL